MFEQQSTFILLYFSEVVILPNQLLQFEFDPASLAVLLVALVAWDCELVHQLRNNASFADITAVLHCSSRDVVKTKAFDAAPGNKIGWNCLRSNMSKQVSTGVATNTDNI